MIKLNHIFQQPADPYAMAVNAISLSWTDYTFYAFPPFSIIQRVLQKLAEEKATGLIIVPTGLPKRGGHSS